ncbi:uncharacterized protein BO88DRAFT_413365 [Aspergillus vadensis CBS 113365]|uniref:Uncharacterized protein n=1 Tax=Aspergillus vadensis (strain CBS 113365 / IMI 142717 / IBT 24658) TaxID=1448311 RepID=A0A319BGU5_ASPVC|nr:hypothetical protein BO88DRAFT_413365 [Aspergillus vadensis CBS 113365]PYH71199.1 hypothetical protein BO88DRAFT_413365 [Aspergillus vadensis CBS 113365]
MSIKLRQKWHTFLNLPSQSNISWHESRLIEELSERRKATTPLARLSETSDVLFTLSRAEHDGFPIAFRPAWSRTYNTVAFTYMLGKFTSRWCFYRVAAYYAGKHDWSNVREVVNPRKGTKLDEVADRHGIDKIKFGRVGRRLLWALPVLP